jgi:hypothetical protein
MGRRLAILSVLVLLISPRYAWAQGVPANQSAQAVVTEFADGRKVHHIIKPQGMGGWTPLFPRVAGVDTDRNGLPLAALDCAMVLDGQQVKVAVTLIYGRPHQHRIAVTTVDVTASGPVRVDQLAAYGVEPIVFSIVPVPPSLLKAPSVKSVSTLLETSVELAREDGPTYRLVIVNRAPQAVRGFGIEGTRGGRKSVTAYRRGQRHATLISAGGAISMDVPTSAIQGLGGTTRVSPDLMMITSVTWEDGTVEGDKASDASERVIAAAAASQLSHVLALMRDAGDVLRPQGLSELRGRIAGLSINAPRSAAVEVRASLPEASLMPVSVEYAMRTGMQQVKELALRDLDEFVNSPARGSAALWVSTTTAAYEEWLARVQKASAPARDR